MMASADVGAPDAFKSADRWRFTLLAVFAGFTSCTAAPAPHSATSEAPQLRATVAEPSPSPPAIPPCIARADSVILSAWDDRHKRAIPPEPLPPEEARFDADLFREAISRARRLSMDPLSWVIQAKEVVTFTVLCADGPSCTVRVPVHNLDVEVVGDRDYVELDERDRFEWHLELERVRCIAQSRSLDEWQVKRNRSDSINARLQAAQRAFAEGNAEPFIALLASDVRWTLVSGMAGGHEQAETWLRHQASARPSIAQQVKFWINHISDFDDNDIDIGIEGLSGLAAEPLFFHTSWLVRDDGRLLLSRLDEYEVTRPAGSVK